MDKDKIEKLKSVQQQIDKVLKDNNCQVIVQHLISVQPIEETKTPDTSKEE